MKRKIALLLASVMALAAPASIYAASDNSLTKVPTVVGKSVLYEEGWLSTNKTVLGTDGYTVPEKSVQIPENINDDIEYVVDGTDLVIKVSQNNILNAGDRFKVKLENAEWFFRGTYPTLPEGLNATVVGDRVPFAALAIANGSNFRASVVDANGVETSYTTSGAYTTDFMTAKSVAQLSDGTNNPDLDKADPATATAYNIANLKPLYLEKAPDIKVTVTTAPATALSPLTFAIDGEYASAIDRPSKVWVNNHASEFPGNVRTTYDVRKGIWGYTDTKRTGDYSKSGEYYRLPQIVTAFNSRNNSGLTADNTREVPYQLNVNGSQKDEAVITILNDVYYVAGDAANKAVLLDQYGGRGSYNEVRIPLVIRTTEKKADVKVKVDQQNVAAISSGTWLFSQTAGGGTSTEAQGIDTARDDFEIDTLKVKETRISSFKDSGIFYIKAADHFEFRDADKATVEVLQGLSWGTFKNTNNYQPTRVADPTQPRTGAGVRGFYWTQSAQYGSYGATWDKGIYDQYRQNFSSLSAIDGDYEIGYKVVSTNPLQFDKQVVEVAFRGIQKSTDVPGYMYIKGLKFTADENAPMGDVMFSIGDVSSNDPVTDEKFKAGVRAQWDIILKAEGTIPELISGRYSKENPIQADDSIHKTARVYFAEASVAAWWGERQTEFKLNDQAKFRKIKVVEVDELQKEHETALKNTRYSSNWKDAAGNFATPSGKALDNGEYINDGEKHGFVTVNGNTVTLNNIKINKDKKAMLRFDAWVSVESGYEGDIKLSVSGSAIPEQSNGGGVAPITIAKAINPIKVVAKVSDIKIGLQYQKTEDIIITETKAGMLEKDKEVYVSVSDLISTDVAFSNDTKVAVTAGNLGVKDVAYSGLGYNAAAKQGDTLIAGQGGTIKFNVSKASSQPSTITISNVSVKVDRTVPETNLKPYKVIVWGPTVAPNYIYHNYNKYARDKFGAPGIMTDYIKVVTAATNKTSPLSSEVKVTIGESFVVVEGKTEEMDAAAYISEASNSTMVPLRFVSKAFGLTDEQVIWDDSNKTVTIMAPQRVLQFKANDSKMKVNGVEIEMQSPDKKSVKAEIKNERMYVPFRAMGDAFGVTVVWDDATKTAIYNPKTSAAPVVAATPAASTPVETATPAATPAATTTPSASPSPSPSATN